MRKNFSDRVERGRVTLSNSARHLESSRGDDYGFFHLTTNDGARLGVMVSSATEEIPWEHVSVSLRDRCPTWAEMSWVKSLFFEDEEPVMQLHPPKSEYVNFHPFCLHMWRPLRTVIPLPPSIAVGPKAAEGAA